MNSLLKGIKRWLAELNGTAAYRRYLDHHMACHGNTQPLSRKAFFQAHMQRKWQGVNRCC